MTGLVNYREPPVPAFLFDLDGTLIDSVYQNVIAWREALGTVDIDLSVWRIHRRIGMSGGLFISALLRETGRTLTDADIEAVQRAHSARYLAQIDSARPLPGAAALLAALAGRRSRRRASQAWAQVSGGGTPVIGPVAVGRRDSPGSPQAGVVPARNTTIGR